MKNYKNYLIVALLTILVLGGAIYKANGYIDGNDEKAIGASVQYIIKDTEIGANNLNIEKIIDIDKRKAVLFRSNDKLGIAHLKSDINNKYKIDNAIWEIGDKVGDIINIEEEQYLLIGAQNYDNKISIVEVNINGNIYRLDAGEDKYLMVNVKMPKLEEGQEYIIKTSFYDEEEKNITNEI
ncbi:hypothetical protein [Clostridium sp.]|uniref:hypothetical protein n=1 Tax=Clostridium sp. TaxID=1506 RepID=UPI003F32D6EF